MNGSSFKESNSVFSFFLILFCFPSCFFEAFRSTEKQFLSAFDKPWRLTDFLISAAECAENSVTLTSIVITIGIVSLPQTLASVCLWTYTVYNSYSEKREGCGWLVGCFGLNGPLRQYFSIYRAVSQREGERGDRIDESKNVQTTPTRTYCKRNRPLPYCYQNCRTPRHWKFTKHHRTTRPPPGGV